VRILFWILAICGLAVALTLAAKHNAGYALLVYPPYRVELSLNLLITLLLAALAASYGLVRLVLHTLNLPAYVRTFRLERKRQRARAAIMEALLAFHEGRYGKAEKLAATALDLPEFSAVGALLAARAAHKMKAYDRRDGYLLQAERLAPGQAAARLMTEAELLLDQRRHQEALAVLKRLHVVARLTGAVRLELKAQQQAKNWEKVLELVGRLEKKGAIDPIYATLLKINAHQENLKSRMQNVVALREYWRKIPAADRADSQIALAAARQFLAFGECQEAMEIVTDSLEKRWDSNLVRLYAECQGDVLKQIERAENWIEQHPQDAALLLTLGRLCAQRELWGKALSYLEASLSIERRAETHLALAQLLEKIGREEEAREQYRLGLTLAVN
jgi:HemY protein